MAWGLEMSRSREVVADPKARHRIDRLTEMEQRCLLRIRGRQENSGNLLGVRWRSMELRIKETPVRRVGLDSSSERRIQRIHSAATRRYKLFRVCWRTGVDIEGADWWSLAGVWSWWRRQVCETEWREGWEEFVTCMIHSIGFNYSECFYLVTTTSWPNILFLPLPNGDASMLSDTEPIRQFKHYVYLTLFVVWIAIETVREKNTLNKLNHRNTFDW